MKVAELLGAYPELEPVLIAQAPPFARLKNPVLRRTVARVATLQQAAAVGGLEVRALIRALRGAAAQGLEAAAEELDAADSSGPGRDGVGVPSRPSWVDAGRLAAVVDADALLAAGQLPLAPATRAALALAPGELLRVDSGFRPAPLIEALVRQGFECWVGETQPQHFQTFFARRP
jgi:hypothetical protein